MMVCHLIRTESCDEGTFGSLYVGDQKLFTAEPPWRENERNISCIPYGEYECIYAVSAKYGPVYRLKDVPGRSDILIHVGNWAGDKALGFKSDSDGCILIGLHRGPLVKQKAITSSRAAISVLHDELEKAPFILTVSGMMMSEVTE